MTLATFDDAVREYAYNVGTTQPDREWILSDYDTWHRNPHYRGKPGRHPEDDMPEDEIRDGVLIPGDINRPARDIRCTCCDEQLRHVGCDCGLEKPEMLSITDFIDPFGECPF